MDPLVWASDQLFEYIHYFELIMNKDDLKLAIEEVITPLLAAFGNRLGNMETSLDGVKTLLGNVETRLGNVETSLDGVKTRLGNLEKKVRN